MAYRRPLAILVTIPITLPAALLISLAVTGCSLERTPEGPAGDVEAGIPGDGDGDGPSSPPGQQEVPGDGPGEPEPAGPETWPCERRGAPACEDGVFCNGTSRCEPTAEGADADGCVTEPACLPEQVCDEDNRRCDTDCARSGDADGDRYVSSTCGGVDCDDNDGAVHPNAPDLCNGIDDDCDGEVDNGPEADAACADLPSGRGICVDGGCSIATCEDGHGDCDGIQDNGCERLLNETVGDCQVLDCNGELQDAPSDAPRTDERCRVGRCTRDGPALVPARQGVRCGEDMVCLDGECVPDPDETEE